MARPRRSGGRGSKASRTAKGISQLPWQSVENTFPPVELLNPEQMEQLHATSMRVLSEAGIRVMGDNVVEIFKQAGALVDANSKNIRIDEDLVNQALKTAPGSFTLTARNPDKQLVLGGNNVSFSLVAGPPN
ncbi:MAG: methyltransferase, partial [Alphaproteobacteria bacterium]|nr:methyltransferase [Alphaproteobacteria bacterium]